MTQPAGASGLLSGVRIDGTTKGFLDLLEPVSLSEVPVRGWTVDDLAPPNLVLRRSALEHNVRVMAEFAAERGAALAPHGKVGMAPRLWWMQLEAGAWGIAGAGVGQARVMRAAGVRRVLIANQITDPASIRWVATALRDEDCELIGQVDSERSVELLEEELDEAGAEGPLPVLVELGHAGGRTGCRDVPSARSLAARVTRSGRLRLAGVSGYEGTLADDRSEASLERVGTFLDDLRALATAVADELEFDEPPIVSAGGSTFFDLAAERLSGGEARVLLRPGCYVTHDHGLYASSSPFANEPGNRRFFRPAIEAWGAVLSTPESGLAILGLGRRDVSFDHGFPRPLRVRRRDGSEASIEDRVAITALNDQHAFCRVDRDVRLGIGDVVRCGISHPCTALEKWRVIPILDDKDRVVDAFATFF
jgi:D-serine deaminase-like pyridoxal phosphate-dependent protein